MSNDSKGKIIDTIKTLSEEQAEKVLIFIAGLEAGQKLTSSEETQPREESEENHQ